MAQQVQVDDSPCEMPCAADFASDEETGHCSSTDDVLSINSARYVLPVIPNFGSYMLSSCPGRRGRSQLLSYFQIIMHSGHMKLIFSGLSFGTVIILVCQTS